MNSKASICPSVFPCAGAVILVLALAALPLVTTRRAAALEQAASKTDVGDTAETDDSAPADDASSEQPVDPPASTDGSTESESGEPDSVGSEEGESEDIAPSENDGATDEPAEQKPLSVAEQARRHHQEGADAMRAGAFQKADSHLKAAVKLVPDNSEYFYALGELYLKQKNAKQSWQYFRKAQQIDPESKKATSAFLQVWNLFERLGAFDIGTSPRRLRAMLGTPDRDVTRGAQKRLFYGFMAVSFRNNRLVSTIDTRDLSANEVRAVDNLVLDLDKKKWKTVSRHLNRRVATVTYLPVAENMREWTERVKVQRMIGLSRRGISAAVITRRIRSDAQRAQPGATWKTIEEKPGDVIVELIDPGNDSVPARHELFRFVDGRNDIHHITYAKQGEKLSFEQRSLWLDELRNAELVEVASAGKAQPAKAP